MEQISRQEAIDKGLARYFTGKPCKNGHVSERWTLSCGCIACADARLEADKKRLQDARAAAGQG